MLQLKLSDFKIIPDMSSIKRIDMSDEEYFSKKYSDYISNSRLKYINPKEGGSIELYNNPPKIETASLKIGSAVHELLLQPDDFVLVPKMGRPSAKLGDVADMVYKLEKDGMDRIDAIREACTKVGYFVNQIDRKINSIIEKCTPYWEKLDEPRWKKAGTEEIILSDKDYDIVESCIKSCTDNNQIMSKLHPIDDFGQPVESYNETAFFVDLIVTYKDKQCARLKFKMKADNYTINRDSKTLTLNDLKTSSKPTAWFMNEEYGSLVHYHYYRQLYLYNWLLWLFYSKEGITKENGWKSECNFLVIHTGDNFDSKCCNLNSYWLKKGKIEAEYCFKEIAAYRIFGSEEEIQFL